MPSPFPGVDPFIEQQEWEDFHSGFNLAISEVLVPLVRPRYIVRVKRRVYVEHPHDSDANTGIPIGHAAMPEERREIHVVIRDRELQMVVTVVETLSPANKRRGGDGWREYLTKRDQILASPSHLVELDLLRGGSRLPMKRPLPTGDYYAIVSRAERRPNADVYAWSLHQRLPTIKIPLLPEDGHVPLDLQSAFETVYERAAYELSLDYNAELDPPLSEADRRVLNER